MTGRKTKSRSLFVKTTRACFVLDRGKTISAHDLNRWRDLAGRRKGIGHGAAARLRAKARAEAEAVSDHVLKSINPLELDAV